MQGRTSIHTVRVTLDMKAERKEKMDACRSLLSRKDGEHWTILRFINLAIDKLCGEFNQNGHGPVPALHTAAGADHSRTGSRYSKSRSPGSAN